MHTLTVQLPGPQRRMILRNRELTEDRGDSVTTRRLESDDEVFQLLSETFGLELAAEEMKATCHRI